MQTYPILTFCGLRGKPGPAGDGAWGLLFGGLVKNFSSDLLTWGHVKPILAPSTKRAREEANKCSS
jgi:hypothetical protein